MDDWTPYVVAQGEYLTKIAHRVGYDVAVVWNDPRNADLKAKRQNPEVLCPGDVLFLPPSPRPPRWLPVQLGTTNRFNAIVPTVKVDITLIGAGGKPLAGKAYTVEGLPVKAKGTTDGGGRVSLSIPVHIQSVTISLDGGRSYRVAVGHMDPIGETSGVLKRLAHLGYLTLDDDPAEDDFELRLALSTFQKDKGLPATGECDDPTRHALADAHGS